MRKCREIKNCWCGANVPTSGVLGIWAVSIWVFRSIGWFFDTPLNPLRCKGFPVASHYDPVVGF